MKKLFGMLLLLFSFTLGVAHAAPSVNAGAAPVADKDYKVLPTRQPVNAPAGKVEVIEFFWYACPHCNEFEPYLQSWVKKEGANIAFKRVPVMFGPNLAPHSKLYYALEQLGVEPRLTPLVFHEINVNRNYLLTPEAQAVFVAKNGVDAKKFLAAYNSFATQNAVQRANQMLNDYRIEGTPTLVVQGKYETGPGIAEGIPGTLRSLDYLVAQVRAHKM